ncbi:MAG: redox-sensing transcriptional repressor Rex, partial [Clostridiales bacterium]|nr:redox-sensing transcriptional repressor Rex [Clostridiales bacterium]
RGFMLSGRLYVSPLMSLNRIRGIQFEKLDDLDTFLKEHDVDIAVLTLPKGEAESAAEKLVSLGIHAIWNFAHLDLNLPKDVVVENVHLSDSLMQLSYNIVKNKTNE